MTVMAGPGVSVADMLEALKMLPRKMTTDDSPGIIKDVVVRGLEAGLFGNQNNRKACRNGDKIETLEKVWALIKHYAGASFDTRHELAQARVTGWAQEVGLPMPSTCSEFKF